MKAPADFLTSKQLLFCNEYLTDMNATRAALRAGYSASVALNGQLMGMPRIKLYLQERMQAVAHKLQVTQDSVLAELAKIAFGNLGDYFDGDGMIKNPERIGANALSALSSVVIKTVCEANGDHNQIATFKMYNKLAALDKIARHIGFYKPEMKVPEVKYVYVSEEDLERDFTDLEEDLVGLDSTDLGKGDFTDLGVLDSTDLTKGNFTDVGALDSTDVKNDSTDVRDDCTDEEKVDFNDVKMDCVEAISLDNATETSVEADRDEDADLDYDGFINEDGEYDPNYILRDGAGIAYDPEIARAEAAYAKRDLMEGVPEMGNLFKGLEEVIDGYKIDLDAWERIKARGVNVG